MRLLRIVGVTVCALILAAVALAGANRPVVRDTNRIIFQVPIRVGTTLLPAGEYIVRHTMEGQDHIMVFDSVKRKGPEVKAKCTLVRLAQKAERTTNAFQMNAANERVLVELVFQGEIAKHVF